MEFKYDKTQQKILRIVAIRGRIFPLKLSGPMLCVRNALIKGNVSASSGNDMRYLNSNTDHVSRPS